MIKNNHSIDYRTKEIATKALNERISMRGICRILDVSFNWLYNFARQAWLETPTDLGIDIDHLRLTSSNPIKVNLLQIDEMWSFVRCKKDKCWIWVVYAPASQQVIAVHFGNRNAESLKKLWSKIPLKLRSTCVFETDHWESYKSIIPAQQHRIGKDLTCFIEGFFTGVRAKVSRLVRKSLSYSKSPEAHMAAIQYFFWQHNLSKQPYY